MAQTTINNETNKIGLVSEIIVNDSSNNINTNKKYINLFEENSFFILKNDKKSFEETKYQGFIEIDETLIFQVKIEKDYINLIHHFDKCYNCSKLQKYYDTINMLNYDLWKVIKKPEQDANDESYYFNLKKNDIFRFGNIKFILREFHVNNEINDNINSKNDNKNNNNEDKHEKNINKNENIEDNNNKNNNNDDINKNQSDLSINISSSQALNYKIINDKMPYTLLLESNPKKICKICNKSSSRENGPLVKLCLCEEYVHFNCKKKEMKEAKYIREERDIWCNKYYIKTNCPKCKKFIPSHFIFKEGDIYQLYQLVDIPFKINEEYLLLETIDFLDTNNEYIKCIFYIKLKDQKYFEENKIISISRGNVQKNMDDNNDLIPLNIPYFSGVPNIVYNINKKTLSLKYNSDTYNTMVLESQYKVEKNNDRINNILLELGNLKIKSYLVNEEEFDKIRNQKKNNPSKIEKRMEPKK